MIAIIEAIPIWTRAAVVWLAVMAAGTLLALAAPRWTRRWAGWFRRGMTRAGRGPAWQQALIVLLPGLTAGLMVLTLGDPGERLPIPKVHDEFSYLLAADTFAHGRLANPAHPFWQHFESFHVNQQPTYVSMYQPGWGLVLAAGQVLFGHPWFAVWLAAIAASLAIHWAARGWLPAPWALAAGVAGGSSVAFNYWMTSYWGGSMPMLGGALLIGSWPRIAAGRGSRFLPFVFGLGGVILLFTRPFGGLAVGLACSAAMLRAPAARRLAIWAPVVSVVVLGAAFLGYYYWRTTGDVTLPPYVLNMQTYHHRKIFLFGSDGPAPPTYRHETMRWMYMSGYSIQPFSYRAVTEGLIPSFDFYGSHLLLFLLVTIPVLARHRRTVPLLTYMAIPMGAALLTVWTRPHYLAPAATGLIILSIQGLRFAGAWQLRGRRIGRSIVVLALTAWIGSRLAAGYLRLSLEDDTGRWAYRRDEVRRELESASGRHLVLVKYAAKHPPNEEWVYNGAELGPAAKIVWARTMNADSDRQLMNYYSDRTVWLLEPDVSVQPRRIER